MTITIKGLTKDTFNRLIIGLDLFAGGDNVETIREDITGLDGELTTLFSVSIHNTEEYTLTLKTAGVNIHRVGVIPCFRLQDNEFDRIFIV